MRTAFVRASVLALSSLLAPAAMGCHDPPAPPAAAAPPPASPKKTGEGTMIIPRGVSLEQLEQGATRASGFDTKGTGFSKKTNKVNTYFIVGGIIVGLIIVGLILFAIHQAGGSHQ